MVAILKIPSSLLVVNVNEYRQIPIIHWPSALTCLLNPFWNHWLSLQCDWLSAVPCIHESHYLLASFSQAMRMGQQNKNNKSDFKVFLNSATNHIAGKWRQKTPLFCKYGYSSIVRFQNGSNKVATELSFDFKTTRMISDQIALHSVQLPHTHKKINTLLIKLLQTTWGIWLVYFYPHPH